MLSNENDGSHSSISDAFLSLFEGLQEVGFERDTSMRQSFNLLSVFLTYGEVDGLFALIELFSGQELSLAVEAVHKELSGQLLVLKVKEVTLIHLIIKIVLILLVLLNPSIEHLAILVFELHGINK